jgi:hypothetical protein
MDMAATSDASCWNIMYLPAVQLFAATPSNGKYHFSRFIVSDK